MFTVWGETFLSLKLKTFRDTSGYNIEDLGLSQCTRRLCPWQHSRSVTSWLGRVTSTKPRRSLVAVTV